MGMSVHTYPFRALIGDYLRAGAGIGLATVPMAAIPSHPFLLYLFGGAIAVFAYFFLRTLSRQLTQIEATDEDVASNMPPRRGLAWRELENVSLRYYSTRRGRSGGWMQLNLAGQGTRISIDSSISGFRDLAARAARAATANGIDLDAASAANFRALDIEIGGGAR
jgi:hypothetical protein